MCVCTKESEGRDLPLHQQHNLISLIRFHDNKISVNMAVVKGNKFPHGDQSVLQ